MKQNIVKFKVNPLDENDTDFIDLDLVMKFCLEEYKKVRRQNQQRIIEQLEHLQATNEETNTEINVKDIKTMINEHILSQKSNTSGLSFFRDITMIRAYLYALVCGDNTNQITTEKFLVASTRFGVDNPCPTITKRLALYGNQEELLKDYIK